MLELLGFLFLLLVTLAIIVPLGMSIVREKRAKEETEQEYEQERWRRVPERMQGIVKHLANPPIGAELPPGKTRGSGLIWETDWGGLELQLEDTVVSLIIFTTNPKIRRYAIRYDLIESKYVEVFRPPVYDSSTEKVWEWSHTGQLIVSIGRDIEKWLVMPEDNIRTILETSLASGQALVRE